MKHTMQYSVGDEVAHVPSNEEDEFNSVAKSQNITPEPIFTYRVSNKNGDVQQLDVPKKEYDEFAKTAADNGYKIEPLRLMTMEDGTERYFSARELRAFTRSDEYLNSPDGVEAKRRQEAVNAEMARMEAERPGFLSELGRNMFTAGGLREVAEDSAWARPYAYANDLANALVGGLVKGAYKIEQGIGHLVGSDFLVNDAKGGQELVARHLPTDMLDTKKPGVVNKVLDVGKSVAEVSGEFAPSTIPGVGQAYAASLVGSGSTIRYMQVYDDAIAHGCEPEHAIALASLGATIDAGQNMLLMGKFKGIWKGEQANLAQAAKEGLARRLTKDTLKTGAIMSVGGMSQDVIDQAAEGAYWLDVGRTAKVGFDQFIEGGLFHLVNTGVHNATRIKWGDDAKGIPAGAARDMMEAPEGRALVFSNSPEAAQKIYMARRRGENVSRKMIEDLGLSGDTARTVADRNAIGDRLVEDYLAFKERVRTKMDDVQAASLADEIASRSDEGVNNPAFEKVWFKAVEKIKDARELDDPERRKQIVDEAVKVTETNGERLQRQKAVDKEIRERQAEYEKEVAARQSEEDARKPMKVKLYDVNGKRIESVSAAEDPVKAPEEAKKDTETPAEAPKPTAEAPVEVPKTPDARKSAENPPPTASEEVAPNKETPVAPGAHTPVLERPTASAPAEANKTDAKAPEEAPKTYGEIVKRLDELADAAKPKNGQKGDVVAGNYAEGFKAVATILGSEYSPKKRIVKSQLDQIARELSDYENYNSEQGGMRQLYKARYDGAMEAAKAAGLEVYKNEDGLTRVRKAGMKNVSSKPSSSALGTATDVVHETGENVPEVGKEAPKTAPDVPKTAEVVSKTETAESGIGAKKAPEVAEKRVEKTAKPELEQGNDTKPRSLSDAVRELMAAKDDLRSVERPTWTDKDTAEDKQKYHDEIISPREKRIAELEAEIDSKRAHATDFAEFTGKPNPKKAAKVLSDFTFKTDKKGGKYREELQRVYHDKKNGVAVASDGRIMIASKHGFDPNADNGDISFPSWKSIVDVANKESNLTAKVNPTELAKVCKTISRLAKTTDGEGEYGPFVAINFGGNHVSYFSASQLAKVAKAMEANGLTEIRTSEKSKHPAITSNGDTSIVIMPFSIADIEASGRGDGHGFVVNGHNGRIITAPERTDTGYQYGHERLKRERESYEKYQKEKLDFARKTTFYAAIEKAMKAGETDPEKIYDSTLPPEGSRMSADTPFAKLKPEVQKDFINIVKSKDMDDVAQKIAEYAMEHDHSVRGRKEMLRDIAKIEKRIGAEDEIEGLIMRSDEARKFLGIDKPKAEAKPSETKAEEKPVVQKPADEKPAEPTKVEDVPAEEVSDAKKSVRLGIEISDLIYKHLKAQATAKNNASGRKLKDEAKAALVDRLSSLSDDEYADVKGRLKEIMIDAGLDPKKSGYVQVIFNAETAKRNAAKPKPAAGKAPTYEKWIERTHVDDTPENRAEWVKKFGGKDGSGIDRQGNPVDDSGKLKVDDVKSIAEITDDDFASPSRNVGLPSIPENVSSAIGSNGRPIVIKKNIFEKNLKNHPELDAKTSRDIIEKSLYNPNLVGQSKPATKPNYKVAVRTGDKNAVTILDVKQDNDHMEIVGWRNIDAKGFERLKRQAAREGGQFLILQPSDEGQPGALSGRPSGVLTKGAESAKRPEAPSTAQSIPESAAEGNAAKAKPGKFIDSVYKTYESAKSFREGAKSFAEDALDEARAKLDERIEKAEKIGDTATLKDLNGLRSELGYIAERIKHGFDERAPKRETHEWLREVLSDINSVEKIDGYEDIGSFVSRRGRERTGVESVDKFNDSWYDEEDGRAWPSDITYGVDKSSPVADRETADLARDYLHDTITFDKVVYEKLSDAEKRSFDKLVEKLDDAKDRAMNTDSTIEDARRYVEAHEAIRTYEENAKKYQSMMRDKDGRPVLFTDKGRADEMARDAAGGAVRAIVSGDKSAAGSAESALRLSVENGAEIPSKADVEKMAAELPEAKREAFVKYMDGWREYAKSMKDKPSIADEASKLADAVDAAIAAEEAGGASGRPDAAPRGRGTGALPQDEPLPQGTATTGKMRGIVTPQSFLKEARKLFPDVAIRGKGTMRMPKFAAGHFEGTYRVIRSRDMNAIRTITHELGHELEYLTRYDLPRTPAAKRDLSDLGHQLYPSGPGMPKPNSYIGEGFAEYIRGYICNAQNLRQVAPDMDAWFRGDFKAKHPEIVKKINRLRDMVQTMKEQSAADTLRGFRHPATTVVERAWKKVTEFASSENWNDSASIILKGMKKSGIDKLFHWQDEFRELEKAIKAGDTVRAQRLAASVSDKIANHPYLFPTITRGTASQRVMDMARYGTTSLLGNVKTGESLKEIFADFSHKEQEAWKDYAIARHGLENYYAKGLEFGMPKDVLEEVVRQYDSPKFQQALQRVTDYSHRILHLGVDSGLISQETYDSIVKSHPIYVRITRRKAEDGAGTKQGGAAINKRTGGSENILDPIDAMLMDQEKFLRACFQARSMQLIVGAANRAKLANLKSIRDNGGPNTSTVNPANQSHIAVGAYWPIEVPNAQEKVTFAAGKLKQGLKEAADDYSARTGEDAIPLHEFINDLATYTDPMGNASMLSIFRDKPSHGKHNLVSVYVDGKLHTYELPDMKWANMLTDVYDKSDFNWAERTFGLATAGIRLGATTINPGFAIRNGIRDSLHSAVMSESGAIPMLGTLNGMLNQLTGKEAAQTFRSMGGHMSDLVGVTKEQKWHHGGQVALAQNPLQSLQAYGAVDWALMKPVIKVTSDILSFPELGPRIREFNGILKKCRAAGLTEDVSAMLAMSHAKDISIDFQRAGRYMKHINHFIPFSNAMWRGTEQTVRNLGLLNALPHQFEDRNLQRGMKTVGKGLAYITSWAATMAMLEMSGDEEDRRQAFEREPKEKWEYEHIGDWRIPLPFEMGYVFGALPKAAVYEMYGDKGAIKECLKSFNQAIPSKYIDPEIALGSVSLFTPIIGILKNEDYRGRAIVPDHIKENRVKEDWYTQYTTELSKKIGGAIGKSPAKIEYLLDSYTGGLYRRTAIAVENIGDTSRLQQGRGFSMLDTLRARPQANRLVGDFYKFGEEAKQKLGSGKISLEEYGKFASMNGTKEELTAKFNAMREIRADKSIPLAEQDERVNAIAKEVNDAIRDFNARDDYRQRGIAYAASHLTGSTPESLDEETRRQYTDLLKDVPTGEIVQALIRFGNEAVLVKQKGVKVPHQRWSNKNINERVYRLLMLMQNR